MKRGPRNRRGLTLVEVLMAVSILGLAFSALLTGASRCLAVIRRARRFQEVQWTFGRAEAEHPFLVEDDIEDLNVDGEDYPNDMGYTRIVEEDEDEDGLHLVRSRVTWMDGSRELYEERVMYYYYPEAK